MLVRQSTSIGVAVCAMFAASVALAAEDRPHVSAVMELFTSQGCSSCPPADALLQSYAKRPDVVALTLPVDYWDYLGWKDTLAHHDFTERQKSYAALRGDRQIYTPQMVVNGVTTLIGSDEAAVAGALAHGAALAVPIKIGMEGDAISVTVGAAAEATATKGTLWLALYKRHVEVPVGRGENTGRKLDYTNVVRSLRRIAMWKGEALKVDFPMSESKDVDADGCAILLQHETEDGKPGAVLGAAHAQKGGWPMDAAAR